MAANSYQDPDYEDIAAGKLNPQDILATQRTQNAQASADRAPATPEPQPAPEAPLQKAVEATTNPQDAASYREGKNTLREAGMAAPIRPRYSDSATETQVAAAEQKDVATKTAAFEKDQARENARRQAEQQRTTAAQARTQAAATAKAQRGALLDHKAAGGLTEHDAAGNEVPKMATRPDGSTGPAFKPGDLGQAPEQDANGNWVVAHRNEFGEAVPVPVEQSPHFHEDATTGEQTFTRDGQKLPLGVNANIAERNQLKTTQVELGRDTQEERLQLADARLRHSEAAHAMKPFEPAVKAATAALTNLQRQLETAKGNGREQLLKLIAEKQKVLADPNYLAAKQALDGANEEVTTRQKSITDRREQSLEITRNLDKLKAARNLPATLDHRQAAGLTDALGAWPAEATTTDAEGRKSIDRDFLEGRVSALVNQTGPATPAAESGAGRIGQTPNSKRQTSNIEGARTLLESLKASGYAAIGGKPIDEEIAKATKAEARLTQLGVIGAKIRAKDSLSFEKFDNLPGEERGAFIQALPADKREGFSKGLATYRAMSILQSAGLRDADIAFGKLDPDQKKLVAETIGRDGVRRLMASSAARAQGATDAARGDAAQAAYDASGTAGKVWANTAALYGGATKGLSGMVTAAPRIYGLMFEHGPVAERSGIQWADNVDAILDDTYSDGRRNSLSETAGQIIGSTLSFLIPTGAAALALDVAGVAAKTARAATIATTMLAGAAINGAGSIQESEQLGLDTKATWTRFLIASGVGTSEALGVPHGFEKMLSGLVKLDRSTQGGFKRLLLTIGREAPKETLEEAGQEFGQNFLTGSADKAFGYKTIVDPESGERRTPKMSEILADSFDNGVQGAAGGLMFGALFAGNAHAKDRARLRQFSQTIDTDGGYGVMHEILGELRGQLATARNEGKDEEVYALKDRIEQAQFALGEAAKKVTALAPDVRTKLGKLIAPDLDADGVGRALEDNEALRFASVEIGQRIREFYPQIAQIPAEGGNAAALDQMIGAHTVAKDLVGVLEGGKIDQAKAVALDGLGLIEMEVQDDGTSIMRVTDDALALFPPALREAVANDTSGKYNFKVTAGQPGALVNNLVKSGEDRIAAEAKVSGSKFKVQASSTGPVTAGEGQPVTGNKKPETGARFRVSLNVELPGGAVRKTPVTVSAANEAEAVKVARQQLQGSSPPGAKITPAGQPVRVKADASKPGTDSAANEAEAVKLAVQQAQGSAPKGAKISVAGKPAPVAGNTEDGKGITTPKADAEKPGRAGTSVETRKAADRLWRAGQAFWRSYNRSKQQLVKLGIGKVKADAKIAIGPMAVDGDTLYYNAEQIAALIEKKQKVNPALSDDEAVALVLDEERWHAIGLTAISNAEAEEIARTAPKNMLRAARQIYGSGTKENPGWDQFSDVQKGHELVRMVLQDRYRGTLTEQMHRAVDKIVAYLRKLIDRLPEDLALSRAVERVQALADQLARESRIVPEAETPSNDTAQLTKSEPGGVPPSNDSEALATGRGSGGAGSREGDTAPAAREQSATQPAAEPGALTKPSPAADEGSANPPGAEPDGAGKAPTTPARKTFRLSAGNDGGFAEHPLIRALLGDAGGIMSRSTAQRKWGAKKYAANKGLWDDAPSLRNPTHNKIYQPNGLTPDEAAQHLIDAGLLPPDAHEAEMWRAIGEVSDSAERIRRQIAAQGRQEKVLAKQEKTFDRDAAHQDKGDERIVAGDLQVGDVVTVDGVPLKVTQIHSETFDVTLEDGEKYGVQEVADGEVIYGQLDTSGRAGLRAARVGSPEVTGGPLVPGAAASEAENAKSETLTKVRVLNAKGEIVETERAVTPELLRELSVMKGVYAQLLDCLGKAAA